MAINGAFMPCGKTYKLSAAVANTATTIAITSDAPCAQYMLANHQAAAKSAYIRVSNTNVAAVVPDATGQYSILVPPSTKMVISGPQVNSSTTVYISLISEDNNAEVYVTPGEGL